MAIDITNIGTLGVSFSRGLDQTWLNLIRKADSFSVEFYQNVEDMDSDEDDEIFDESATIPPELGERILRDIFDKAQLESWQAQYTGKDDGPATDLNWTIDVDDTADADLLMVSGNGKLPPEGRMSAVMEAVRAAEDRFGRCFPEFR